MSWTVVAQKISEPAVVSTASRYKITAFQKGEAGALSSELDIDREQIMNDYYNLLPYISGIRFRSQTFQQLNPFALIDSVKNRLYSSLNNDLKNVFDTAQTLHLITDDIDIPWEMISCCNESYNLKYSFGISRLSKRRFISSSSSESAKSINVLIIVDTKNNLPQTKIETQKIISMFNKINRNRKNTKRINYVILEGEEATYNNVRKCLIQNYFEIIHTCTHTEYNGIVLYDGLLRPEDIFDDIRIGAPWLVFMNSCESAKTKDLDTFEKLGQLSDLNIAFLAAGANSYIGTNCIINDSAASEIAVNFYINLLQGFTLGDSLRNAKNKFHNDNRDDLSWLSFRLFADPTLKKDFGNISILLDSDLQVNEIDKDEDDKKENDLQIKILEYIQNNKTFSISKCARDLNVDVDEIMNILSKL